MLSNAQYSRITVGNRWLTAGHPKFVVMQEGAGGKAGRPFEVIRTLSEDLAVNELLKGEPLYSNLTK